MIIQSKLLDEVYLLDCNSFNDSRGSFTKLFQSKAFLDLGLDFVPAEIFMSQSKTNVIRGMHYQSGIAAHDKLIYCSHGSLLDVIVDIRPDSPSFNQPVSIKLDSKDDFALYIGKGYAHGFLSYSDNTTVLYSTSTIHDKYSDKGVLWSSINFDWPVNHPIISERDQNHPSIISLL